MANELGKILDLKEKEGRLEIIVANDDKISTKLLMPLILANEASIVEKVKQFVSSFGVSLKVSTPVSIASLKTALVNKIITKEGIKSEALEV